MPRRISSRLVLPGFACCYHITQRCQERRYLLRHAKDRRQYLKRLWETSRRYPVSVLNYMITSNHVHLLLWSASPRHVSAAMQYLSGAAAQDYNRRLDREGAFWRGRYRPTLVEDGHHLTRCFFYVAQEGTGNLWQFWRVLSTRDKKSPEDPKDEMTPAAGWHVSGSGVVRRRAPSRT